VIRKEEIRETLWSDDTIVEFENSVHPAIKKLRVALADSAENPTYIETLPRKGYRFIGPLEVSEPEQAAVVPLALPEGVANWPHLEQDETDGVETKALDKATKKDPSAWLVASVLALLIGAGVIYWISRRAPDEASDGPMVASLTTSGWGWQPSFSPDGNQVAFVWRPDSDGNRDIYIKQIGTESLRRLTTDPHVDFFPAWSPDGQFIAFARDLESGRGAVMMIPANGGRECQLVDLRAQHVAYGSRWLCWHPDGKWLAVASDQDDAQAGSAIYLLSPATGERRRLTAPPKAFGADTNPAFSPDGNRLIFVRSFGGSSEVFLLGVSDKLWPDDEPKQLTFGNKLIVTLAWMPDGKSIIYSSGSHFHSARLWRLSVSGSEKPKPLPFSGQGIAMDPAVSPQKQRLVYGDWHSDINIWRHQISVGKPAPASRLLTSTKVQETVQYSPDGKSILYVTYVSGNAEIWLCDENGSSPLQLTHLNGPMPWSPYWSPDGREIVFSLISDGQQDLYSIPALGGQIRQRSHTRFNEGEPSYSRDGQWIYYDSDRDGTSQVWKVPAQGGEEVQVTREGGSMPRQSVDGKTLYYLKAKYPNFHELWKVPVAGGEEGPRS